MTTGLIVYLILENLGAIDMPLADKWYIGLKIIGMIGAGSLAAWTIYSWVLSKKIEIEMSLLENMASGRAHFLASSASKTLDEATKIEFQQFLDMYTKTTNKIISKNLGLAELMTLNKRHAAATKFIQEYVEIREKP